jgi:hypothetical protein
MTCICENCCWTQETNNRAATRRIRHARPRWSGYRKGTWGILILLSVVRWRTADLLSGQAIFLTATFLHLSKVLQDTGIGFSLFGVHRTDFNCQVSPHNLMESTTITWRLLQQCWSLDGIRLSNSYLHDAFTNDLLCPSRQCKDSV